MLSLMIHCYRDYFFQIKIEARTRTRNANFHCLDLSRRMP